jgi:hypothetical protein
MFGKLSKFLSLPFLLFFSFFSPFTFLPRIFRFGKLSKFLFLPFLLFFSLFSPFLLSTRPIRRFPFSPTWPTSRPSTSPFLLFFQRIRAPLRAALFHRTQPSDPLVSFLFSAHVAHQQPSSSLRSAPSSSLVQAQRKQKIFPHGVIFTMSTLNLNQNMI